MSFLRLFRQPSWTIGTLVRAHLFMFGGGFIALGVSQILQPDRWMPRPSFGLLYQLLTVREWGVLFLVIGMVKLGSAIWYPRFALVAITAGAALVAAWAVSFILRYLTDPSTPPAFAVTWIWLTMAHVGVASMLAPKHDRGLIP